MTAREAGSDEYAYEVMYLLDSAGDAAADELTTKLRRLGDCVSVAGDGNGLWTIHVHCNDVGAAIEAGVQAGRPHRITVARFADEAERVPTRFRRDRAVVVPVHGPGLAALFRAEGAVVFEIADDADRDRDPDVWDLLDVITSTGASQVTVLPGSVDLMAVADEAAIRAVAAGQDVVVVPCASPVQAMAALAVHDPARRAGDDVVAMAEAAAATRRGEVTIAGQDAITWIGSCQADDVLGFVDGEVILIERGPSTPDTLAKAALGVARRMLAPGGELVTVVLGARAPDELGETITEFLRREHPEVEVGVYHGGGRGEVVRLGVE